MMSNFPTGESPQPDGFAGTLFAVFKEEAERILHDPFQKLRKREHIQQAGSQHSFDPKPANEIMRKKT